MAELQAWMAAQIEQRKVEPNSGLGEAIAYMRKHWNELTLFLSAPGAPLDNNICERALKKAILHRKNSYFYRTENGAHVGDLFMSLIHTCELNGANPFQYLTELQKHACELAAATRILGFFRSAESTRCIRVRGFGMGYRGDQVYCGYHRSNSDRCLRVVVLRASGNIPVSGDNRQTCSSP
jgi:hypothetical protein